MTPYYQDDHVRVFHGKCETVLAELPVASVHAVVCDPPYELGFMGKGWDASGIAYSADMWREVLRVLKPGGHLLAFGGPRTYHRLTCAIEDAGFEIRDGLMWLYGSGFPKSLDVSKAIDKASDAEREVVGTKLGLPGYSLTDGNGDHRTYSRGLGNTGNGADECAITAPATDDAKQWDGWGTALKPAIEPIVMARKPLSGTVAATVLAHGTGALNVDGCRVATTDKWQASGVRSGAGTALAGSVDGSLNVSVSSTHDQGRWPTNVVLTHADCGEQCADDCPVAELDRQSGARPSGGSPGGTATNTGIRGNQFTRERVELPADSGGASRYFPVFRYEGKADAGERPKANGVAHPTVKPVALMRWLVRLVTPPGGTVLDPFAGSGTTLQAARAEGFDCIGIEQHTPYLPLIRERLERVGSPVNAERGGWPGEKPTTGQASIFDLGGDAA